VTRPPGGDPPLVVEYGRKISIEYTIRLDDGSLADSNAGGEPLVFQQGMEQVLPALEEALEGLPVGARKKLTLPPEQSFGPWDERLRTEARLDQLPEEAQRAGGTVGVPSDDGHVRAGRVVEIRGGTAVVDLNHPAAGKTVHFDVRILSID
jgi:FKBP-type peptidyl-prolyl cis-trans isomerase SlyD